MTDTKKLVSQFYIHLDGNQAPEELMAALASLIVENSLYLPDVATLVIHDPRLQWVDDDRLMPGKALKVSAKVGNSTKPIFDGEIVEIEPDYGPSTQNLTVRAFDRLHRLKRGRHVRSFVNVKDSDLMSKLAQEAGLSAQVTTTSEVHPYALQNNQTNLEFLQQRAAALGHMLYVKGEKLHCHPFKEEGAAIQLQWGVELGTFRPRLSTIDQVNKVLVRGWDPMQRQEIVGQAQKGNSVPKIGVTQSGGDLAKQAFKIEAQEQVADRPIRTQTAATQLAQAEADRHAGRFVEAEGTCGGNPGVVAGVTVSITAVGTRFSGTYFVTSTAHVYRPEEGYRTEFTVSGMHPSTLLALLRPEGDSPGVGGLVIGIVTDNNDPEGLGRVKVKYPWLSSEHASDWARVVSVGAGPQRGIAFLPEVNDEVLVAFELGDIHHPYVIGGLWNGRDKPPKSGKELVKGGKVEKRVIRSRAGHEIIFDDADAGGGITIIDKGQNKIFIDSKTNALTIEIKGNITLTSKGNLKLESTGNLDLNATGNLTVSATGKVDIKGLVINLN